MKEYIKVPLSTESLIMGLTNTQAGRLFKAVFNYAFNDIAYLIGEDGMLEEKIDWSELYGELENGEYRLVKELYINGYNYFSVEFTIE